MTSLKLDSNNDIEIVNNKTSLVDSELEIEQKIKTVLRTIRGECFLDTTKGLPYITSMTEKNVNLDLVADLIKNEIASIESVDSIDDFSLELLDTRELIITATVNGNINLNQQI